MVRARVHSWLAWDGWGGGWAWRSVDGQLSGQSALSGRPTRSGGAAAGGYHVGVLCTEYGDVCTRTKSADIISMWAVAVTVDHSPSCPGASAWFGLRRPRLGAWRYTRGVEALQGARPCQADAERPCLTVRQPPRRQPRGKIVVSSVNSHSNATRIG